jgi:hypothetical protein
MLALHQYKIKRKFNKSYLVLPGQLYNLTDPQKFLLQQKHPASQKNIHKRYHVIKRMSPLLSTAVLLPVAFISLFIVRETSNKLLSCFLFICMEINILFTDFALWNYYEGKKILRI